MKWIIDECMYNILGMKLNFLIDLLTKLIDD